MEQMIKLAKEINELIEEMQGIVIDNPKVEEYFSEVYQEEMSMDDTYTAVLKFIEAYKR